jgi:hypothetical protein
VRTFNPDDTRASGCLYAILVALGAKFVWAPPPPKLNVLGEVKETVVTFGASDLATVELPLRDTQIWSRGVGAYYDTWHWQYQLAGGAWSEFQISLHKAYVLLDVPTLPWTQAVGATNLPWTEVLDFACGWASGRLDRDQAAASVAERIFSLGPTLIEYDCPGGGGSAYAWPNFDCSAFLDRLRGGPGLGQWVNCTDCATFSSTFANALGCDLWQSRMGGSGFDLNPILAIGSSVWQPACPSFGGGFSYHEVAWKDGCTENDAVFDACLKVDGDADPTVAPQTPLLPTNMTFGASGAGLYRDRLATPAGRATCTPQPATRKRRSIY